MEKLKLTGAATAVLAILSTPALASLPPIERESNFQRKIETAPEESTPHQTLKTAKEIAIAIQDSYQYYTPNCSASKKGLSFAIDTAAGKIKKYKLNITCQLSDSETNHLFEESKLLIETITGGNDFCGIIDITKRGLTTSLDFQQFTTPEICKTRIQNFINDQIIQGNSTKADENACQKPLGELTTSYTCVIPSENNLSFPRKTTTPPTGSEILDETGLSNKACGMDQSDQDCTEE